MPKMITKTIKEIFDKNSKKEFSNKDIVEIMDNEYAIVPSKSEQKIKAGFSTRLTELTRKGFLIRRKGENGVYLYKKRGI